MLNYPVDTECLFCKIVDKTVSCSKVYEDDYILAFLDINPITKGHTLIVPKGHYATLLDFPEAQGNYIIRAIKSVAKAVMLTTKAEGFNCFQNNFSAAGQMIFHIHWHILPRVTHDGLISFPSQKYESQEEMSLLARSINKHLPS